MKLRHFIFCLLPALLACTQQINQVVEIDTHKQTGLLNEVLERLPEPAPSAALPTPSVRPSPTPTPQATPTPTASLIPRQTPFMVFPSSPTPRPSYSWERETETRVEPSPEPTPRLPYSVRFRLEGKVVNDTYSKSLYLKLFPEFRDKDDKRLEWEEYLIFFDLVTENGDRLAYFVDTIRAERPFLQPESIYLSAKYDGQEVVIRDLIIYFYGDYSQVAEIKEGWMETGYHIEVPPSPTPTPRPTATPVPSPEPSPEPTPEPSPEPTPEPEAEPDS